MRKLFAACVVIACLLAVSLPARAADRYWVGGTGNWDASTTTHWAASSGGAGGESVPTSADNVIFDEHSNEPGDGDYTVTITATANCADLTFANPPSGVVTLAGAYGISIYGSLSYASGMTASYTGTMTFSATSGTKTIATNTVVVNGAITVNGSGGTFQLSNDLAMAGNTRWLYVINGTFDANGKSVTFTGTNMDVNGVTFYDMIVSTGGVRTASLALNSNITVTHALTITGNSATNRVLVASNTKGTARTITAASVTVTNADFQDITGAGTGSWDLSAVAGGSGNCGGNTGITFTTADDWYYHAAEAGADSTSTVGKWFTATNGGGSVSTYPPLPQDTQKFDANSFDAGGVTVTQDMPRIGSVDWTGATNTPTWTTSTIASVFGSITLISGMTLTASSQAYTFEGRGSYTLTSAGKTWGKPIIVMAPSGTLTISDAFISTSSLSPDQGTLTANNINVTARNVAYTTTGKSPTVNLGTGIWTVTEYGAYAWNIGTTVTMGNVAGSTIKFTDTSAIAKTFVGQGATYNNLWFSPGAGTGGLTITGTNTFTGTLTLDGSAAYAVTFPNSTTTVADMTRSATTNAITFQRTGGSGTWTIAKTGGNAINLNYINVSNSAASPASTWYAGPNSVNGGGNTGWQFNARRLILRK